MAESNVIFPPSKRKQMQMLREQGLTYQKIAEQFGVSKQYVAQVCGKRDPAHFAYVSDKCIYPNLRDWMNKNKVSRMEFVRRMGLTTNAENCNNLSSYINGKTHPRKQYIDKMLKVTGLTYEEMFCVEVDDGE